jgi:hypothetical protein
VQRELTLRYFPLVCKSSKKVKTISEPNFTAIIPIVIRLGCSFSYSGENKDVARIRKVGDSFIFF